MYRVVAVKKDRIQTIAEKVKIVCYSQNANFGGFHRNLLADFWRILADSIAILSLTLFNRSCDVSLTPVAPTPRNKRNKIRRVSVKFWSKGVDVMITNFSDFYQCYDN
jgi:hypothetical protein